MTREDHTKEVESGHGPNDLDRVTCPKAGQLGHGLCGWCERHDKPRHICGCVKNPPPSQDSSGSMFRF